MTPDSSAAASSATAPTARTADAIEFGPCTPPVEGAECGTLTVPLSYAETAKGTLEVAVMRILSEQPDGRQLWYLAGGPGGAGTSLLSLLHQRYGAAWAGADLYAIDHRGTGGSHRLSCPEQEAPDTPAARLLAPEEFDPCIATLRQKHGDVLPHLTISNAARDLGAAIEALGADHTVLLWGNSYGTHWAHRYLQLFPEQADGVFIEALVPGAASYRSFDYWMNDAGVRVMTRCAEQPTCRERFATDPVELARSLRARLNDGHCSALELPVPITWVLGSMLYDPDLRGLLPVLLHLLDRCETPDVARLRTLYDVMFGDRGTLTAGDFSAPLYIHVILSELWTGEPPAGQTLAQVSGGCLFCPSDRAVLDEARARWPTYEPDALTGRIADYDGPLWMLQGGLDPGIAPAVAATMAEDFDAPRQHYIAFETSAHTLIGKTPAPKADCALELLHAFVEDPTQPPPRQCVDDVVDPGFALGPSPLTEVLLGPGDPWAAPSEPASP